MDATNILLIRHGQTEWNTEGRFQGQLDSNLSALGKTQASALASSLASSPVTQIYSSDLGRALNTAQLIRGKGTPDVQTDPRLRERAMGVFEGNTRTEIEEQFSQAWKRYKSLAPDYEIEGGGESILDVERRARAFLEEVVTRHRGQTVACVSHGGLIRIVLKSILEIPFENQTRFKVQNTSLHHIVHDDLGWAIETLGSVAHLPPAHQEPL